MQLLHFGHKPTTRFRPQWFPSQTLDVSLSYDDNLDPLEEAFGAIAEWEQWDDA